MNKLSNKLKFIITVLLCLLTLSSCVRGEIKEGIVKTYITNNHSIRYPSELFVIQDDKHIIPNDSNVRFGARTAYYLTEELEEIIYAEKEKAKDNNFLPQVDYAFTLPDVQIAIATDYYTEPIKNEIWKYKDGQLTKKELPGGFHYIHFGMKNDKELFLVNSPQRSLDGFTIQYTVVDVETLEYEHYVNNIKISDCTDSKTIMSLWESGYLNDDYFFLDITTIQLVQDRLYLAIDASINKTAKTWLVAFDAKTGNDPVMKFIEGRTEGIAVDGEEIFILDSVDAFDKDETAVVYTTDLSFNEKDRYVFKTEGYKIGSYQFVYYDGIMTFSMLSKNNNQLSYIYEYDVAKKELKRLEKPINGMVECINIHEYKDGIFYNVI